MEEKTKIPRTASGGSWVAWEQMAKGRLSQLGGKLAARAPLWAGRVCWSSVWACLHADRWQGGRERHTGRWDSLVSLRRGWNTQRGGEQWSEAESHRLWEGTMRRHSPHKRRVWARVRDTDGQEERGRKWQNEGGKAVGFPHPSSLPPRLCWQCHALVKRDYQSPAWGCMYGHSHYLCPAHKWHCCLNTNGWLSDPPALDAELDLAEKM